MSEESGNGRGVFFLFYVVVPVLYFVLRIFPYLCFYVLPFAVASLLIGGAWVFGCQAGFTEYKRVAIFFPVTVFLLIMTVDFPSRIPEELRKKNYVESPALYNAFNDMKSGMRGLLTGLGQVTSVSFSEAPSFRRPNTSRFTTTEVISPGYCGFLFVWELPAFFLYQAKKDDDGKIADLRALFDAKVKTEQGKATEYFNDYLREKNGRNMCLRRRTKK